MGRVLTLGLFLALAGCATPLPLDRPIRRDAAAEARLRDSAEAHGLAAYRHLSDVAVRYRQADLLPIINEHIKLYQEGKMVPPRPPLRTKPYSTGGIDT